MEISNYFPIWNKLNKNEQAALSEGSCVIQLKKVILFTPMMIVWDLWLSVLVNLEPILFRMKVVK